MDANLGNWPNVLRAAEKLKVKQVLPGHGEPAGRDLLDGQAEFFSELYKAVKSGVDSGKKMEELQASIKLPESVHNWVSDGSLKGQIRDAYDEIKQGKPRGEIGK
jgi:hypothetical protein